jgi:DNA-binding response OmpR family regulator
MVSTHSFKKLSILIVEDDVQMSEAVIDALETEGHSVTWVDCAEEIPELKSLTQLDIAILDVNLPDESGFSLAKRMRASHPDLGIIILSALADTEFRSFGYENYLTKPIHLNDLMSAISSFSRRLKLAELPSQSSLELDMQTLTLQWKGEKTEITYLEALLLSSFTNAPQKVLENQAISNILEIEHGPKAKSLIELRISRLRKKFPKVQEFQKPVRSIHGKGYKLCVQLNIV